MSLPLLIIGPNSTMLISGSDMPVVPITATDDLGKKNQVKGYLSNPANNLTALMNIDLSPSLPFGHLLHSRRFDRTVLLRTPFCCCCSLDRSR